MQRQQLECGIERMLGTDRGHAGDGAGSRQVIISTEKPVRSGGGIARAAGCVTSGYMQNPVVMWGHNYKEPPIARATALEISSGVGIVARFEFPPAGIHPLADTVRGLWDAGFINAASIGFSPLEYRFIDDPEDVAPLGVGHREREQIPEYTRWELYEFSLVAVPRDRDAVRRALDSLSSAPHCGGREPRHVEAIDALERANVGALERLNVGTLERLNAGDGLAPVVAAEQVPALDLSRFLDGLRTVRRVFNGT